jgi:hypothetical protein
MNYDIPETQAAIGESVPEETIRGPEALVEAADDQKRPFEALRHWWRL